MMRHDRHAMFVLPVKGGEVWGLGKGGLVKVCWGWKCFILSTHLLSVCRQSQASVGQRQMKAQIGSVWGGRTVSDVPPSGDLDIISCPSSKRHQTRCWIPNRNEEGKKKVACVFWLHGARMDLAVFCTHLGPILIFRWNNTFSKNLLNF